MNISLNQEDIDKALVSYVESLGFDTSDKEAEIIFKAARGSHGYAAQIVFSESEPKEPTPVVNIKEAVVDDLEEETTVYELKEEEVGDTISIFNN